MSKLNRIIGDPLFDDIQRPINATESLYPQYQYFSDDNTQDAYFIDDNKLKPYTAVDS